MACGATSVRGGPIELERLRGGIDRRDVDVLEVDATDALEQWTRRGGDPGRQWSLNELARAARMSPTTFADRFRSVAGTPPLTYLGRWRMLLAQRALREADTRVGVLATRLGYGSESAFSNAFTRETGVSPLSYRRQLRHGTARIPEADGGTLIG